MNTDGRKRKQNVEPGGANKSSKKGDDASKNLTPTQLRNARKRKAKRKNREGSCLTSDTTRILLDPSLEFIENPTQAPIIQEARNFFFSAAQCNNNNNNMDWKLFVGSKYKWRTLIKLAVRPNAKGRLSLGLFQAKSHGLVPDSATSPLHHSALNRTMTILEKLARKLHVPAFCEKKTNNNNDKKSSNPVASLKYVTASVERSTEKVQLTLIWQEGENSNENKILHDFCQALLLGQESNNNNNNPDLLSLHSLWIHYHPPNFSPHNNAIYALEEGGRWETRHGPSCGTREILDLHFKQDDETKTPKPTLYFPPNVFRQANVGDFGRIVGQIRTFLQQQQQQNPPVVRPHLLELYGGVGTIGLHLVDLCASYICSDENPNNEACFQRSVASLEKHDCSIQYIPKNATDMVKSESQHFHQADWIIVDPPRKGLEDVVCQALCQFFTTTTTKSNVWLVYVSCGFTAFARDCQLLQKKHWNLVHANGHVLFPGSNAIETLAFFQRKCSGK